MSELQFQFIFIFVIGWIAGLACGFWLKPVPNGSSTTVTKVTINGTTIEVKQ